MGRTPVVYHGFFSLDDQLRNLEREVARRHSRLPWRRASARRVLPGLIRLREHAVYGWHDVHHRGACARGVGLCGPTPPPKPRKAAEPTYAERLDIPAGWRGINIVQTVPVTSGVPEPRGLPPAVAG